MFWGLLLNWGCKINILQRKTKEIELFETNRRINEDLGEIIEDKSEKYEVVNVISNFQPIGNEVVKKEAFQLAALFALVTILGLLFLKLNSYLNNYKK